MVAQGQRFLRTFHRVALRASSAATTQLTFVSAEIRRRPVRKRRQKLIQASGACKYKKLFHLRRIQEN
jgi:hypothetical protein